MKPFNLERALAGDPVVTGRGLKVTKITHFEEVDDPYKLRVQINNNIFAYTEKGTRLTKLSHDNLFMAPIKKTIYVNLNTDGSYCTYSLEENARQFSRISDIATAIPVEIEE